MTPHLPDHHAIWIPCGTCWGQRRLYSATDHGVLEAHSCPSCLGLGERLADGDQVPAAAG